MRDGRPSQLPAPVLTPASKLNLALLNLRTIPGLTDIEPFSLQAVLADNQQQVSLSDAERRRAQRVSALSNAKQLGLGIAMYAQDHAETVPPLVSADAFKSAIYPYEKTYSVFADPETNTPFTYNAYYSRWKLARFQSPATAVLIFSGPDADNKRIVGFADSRATEFDEAQWQSLKAASHIP